VRVVLPDPGNALRGGGALAGCGRVDLDDLPALAGADQAQVQRRGPPIAGDAQHVVLLGFHQPVADRLRAVPQLGDVGADLIAGGHDDGLRSPLPVVAGGQLRNGQVQVLRGFHVGTHMPHAQQLRGVAELREPGLHPPGAPVRRHFQGADGGPERGRPGVEVADARLGEQIGAQVALHDVGLGDGVRDRGGGGPDQRSAAVPLA